MVEYIIAPTLTSVPRDLRLMTWINKAHAVMLVRQGILSRDVGKGLLVALDEMDNEDPEAFSIDPALEDLYSNIEQKLVQKVGTDVGGRLHTGRSRNDLLSTTTRMAVREALADLMELLFGLRQDLLDQAREHVDTVMPGYTHLQPAQPTTLGHYLTSVVLALERDSERLLEAHPRLNLNPLGAGAFAGTGFPIDRSMTADLLGFDGVVESTMDAVASRDYVPEILAALAGMGVTLSRLAQDLYLWCSDEWGTVELADEVSFSSSIMPQKKNPATLEQIKAKAGHLIGGLVSSLIAQKGVNFMHCRDMSIESVEPIWDGFAQAEAVIRLTRRTFVGITVRKELLLRRAVEDFCTATELADLLVREEGLPFRLAHGIVANVVSLALDRGLRSDDITSDLIRRAAGEVTTQPISLTPDQVKRALDPVLNLDGKKASGSPAATETGRLIAGATESLERHRGTVAGWQDRQQRARKELDQAVAQMT